MQWVLYGIFPVVVGTSVLSYWRARLALHPASKFEALEPGVKVRACFCVGSMRKASKTRNPRVASVDALPTPSSSK